MMKTLLRCSLRLPALTLALTLAISLRAQNPLPRPDHTVVVIYENHGFSQIIGSPDAPYINALATDAHSALFTQSYAITHPSQPNYIDLYSGCNQGVFLDFLPTGYPWTTDNLGRQLLDSGYTWRSYSEDLPSVGSDIETNLSYVRRHNPAANWVGTGANQIPASTNRPFTDFPTDFDSLPTVCFIAPNLDHDMHDGTPAAGDAWLQANLDAYVQWAKTHNSLLIFTYDEDDGILISSNHIATIFAGQQVQGGSYSTNISHYSVLRTIEEMYGLPPICNATGATTITDCWRAPLAVQPGVSAAATMSIFPQPAQDQISIRISESQNGSIEILNLQGQRLLAQPLMAGKAEVDVAELPAGLYLVQVKTRHGITTQKFVVE